MNTRAILYALLSAVLFGISTPAAKALLGSTDPTVLAGLLYCGAGVGVALRPADDLAAHNQARLRRELERVPMQAVRVFNDRARELDNPTTEASRAV
jgi:hypothetical protein